MAQELIQRQSEENILAVAGLIERFLEGVTEASRPTYAKSLRQMFAYFAANGINNPTRESLVDWLEELKASGKSPSTIQLYLTAAKIFFRWTSQEGIYANIADHMKSGVKPTHGHKKDALTTEQCAELIRSVKCKGNELMELRDKAILSLMTTAGLRTVEVVRANVGDIRFERGKVFLSVQGKGRAAADEKVLLGKKTYKAIDAYLQKRGALSSKEALFVSTSRSNRGARLDTQTVSKMVKKNLREMGLDSPRLTANSLRHSVATNLIKAGAEVGQVQQILRHENADSTMIYVHAEEPERYQNDGEQRLDDAILSTPLAARADSEEVKADAQN